MRNGTLVYILLVSAWTDPGILKSGSGVGGCLLCQCKEKSSMWSAVIFKRGWFKPWPLPPMLKREWQVHSIMSAGTYTLDISRMSTTLHYSFLNVASHGLSGHHWVPTCPVSQLQPADACCSVSAMCSSLDSSLQYPSWIEIDNLRLSETEDKFEGFGVLQFTQAGVNNTHGQI